MSRFTIHDAAQGTEEWFVARAGRATGSRAGDLMAKGEGKTRAKYLRQLVSERLTGVPSAGIKQTDAMKRGNELEPKAREAYEVATGFIVRETGFLAHSEIMAGCSVDGDVDRFRRIIEIKCPDSTTHLEYLLNPESLFKDYRWQVTHNLWLTGAESCDLVSFDDRFLSESQRIVVLNVGRDRIDAQTYEKELAAFLKEAEEIEAKLRERKAA